MSELCVLVPTPDAMRRLAQVFCDTLMDPLARSALMPGLVLDLRGHLGSGKTVFVRGLARALGVPTHIPILSPTFTLHRAYALNVGQGPCRDLLKTLHHLDAYRLSGSSDLETIGFEELCEEGCLTAVEWGDRVENALPADRLQLVFETVEIQGAESAEHTPVRSKENVAMQNDSHRAGNGRSKKSEASETNEPDDMSIAYPRQVTFEGLGRFSREIARAFSAQRANATSIPSARRKEG